MQRRTRAKRRIRRRRSMMRELVRGGRAEYRRIHNVERDEVEEAVEEEENKR